MKARSVMQHASLQVRLLWCQVAWQRHPAALTAVSDLAISSVLSSLMKMRWLRLTIEEQNVAGSILVGRGKRCMPSELQERSLEEKFSARADFHLSQANDMDDIPPWVL